MFSGINEALQSVELHARPRSLGAFPNVPVEEIVPALASHNSQILVGRSGAGKTHLLLELERRLKTTGQACAFVDLRIVGTAADLYSSTDQTDNYLPATRLAVDVLAEIHDALQVWALREGLLDETSSRCFDELQEAITDIRVAGEEERQVKTESDLNSGNSHDLSIGITAGGPGASYSYKKEHALGNTQSTMAIQKGHADVWLHLGSVARSLSELSEQRGRLFVLLDEWDSVPLPLQPWLADLLRRLLWDTSGCVVKIARGEPPRFAQALPDGRLGLDASRDATVDLDAAFSQLDLGGRRQFLLELLYQHVASVMTRVGNPEEVGDDSEAFANLAFADESAITAFIDSSEGNPGDALIIAGRAAQLAGLGPVRQTHVLEAAHFLAVDRKLRHIEPDAEMQDWLSELLRTAPSRSFRVPLLGGEPPRSFLAFRDRRLLHADRPLDAQPREQWKEQTVDWHVDFGYALVLMRDRNATVDEVRVPPVADAGIAGAIPKFGEDLEASSQFEEAPTGQSPVKLPDHLAGLQPGWLEMILNTLPAFGDFLIFPLWGSPTPIEMTESPTFLGRSVKRSTVQIPQGSVSGRHAELSRTPGGWRLTDCGSLNGTTLNGRDIEVADLHSLDLIGLASAQLLYVKRG